jgi:hypothetical protein
MSGQITLKELPPQDAPGYFRLLVRNCIETYKELPNDAMCLDYNKVSGKLRALVLDDEEYKRETRNSYAQRQLEELREINTLMRLATDGGGYGEEDSQEAHDPRRNGKQGKKGPGVADKDSIAMRLKAAQIRRELIASLNEDNNASERDAVNFLYVAMTREEVNKNVALELYEGSEDGALDELAGPQEEMPEGTGGKARNAGKTKPLDGEDFFEVLEDGEIVER